MFLWPNCQLQIPNPNPLIKQIILTTEQNVEMTIYFESYNVTQHNMYQKYVIHNFQRVLKL